MNPCLFVQSLQPASKSRVFSLSLTRSSGILFLFCFSWAASNRNYLPSSPGPSTSPGNLGIQLLVTNQRPFAEHLLHSNPSPLAGDPIASCLHKDLVASTRISLLWMMAFLFFQSPAISFPIKFIRTRSKGMK